MVRVADIFRTETGIEIAKYGQKVVNWYLFNRGLEILIELLHLSLIAVVVWGVDQYDSGHRVAIKLDNKNA